MCHNPFGALRCFSYWYFYLSSVKELSIAELGQLTKVCQDTMIQKSGSQKRKARKSAISHLVLVKPCVGGKSAMSYKNIKKVSDTAGSYLIVYNILNNGVPFYPEFWTSLLDFFCISENSRMF